MPRYLILFHRLSETTKSVSTINTQFSIAIIGSKLNTSFLVSRWFKPRLFKYRTFHIFPGVFNPRRFLEGYEQCHWFQISFSFYSCACKLLIRISVSSTGIPPLYSHRFVVCSLNSLFLKKWHLLPINLYYPMCRYHRASKARTSNAVMTFYKSYICSRVVLFRFGPLLVPHFKKSFIKNSTA